MRARAEAVVNRYFPKVPSGITVQSTPIQGRGTIAEDARTLQCQRLPPHASPQRNEFAFWPKVLADHWCGDHAERAEADGDE